MKEKEIKEKDGITLIALVITIIVLLILAGVSISMLAGDNAILNRATQAKEKSETSETKGKIQMAVIGAMTNGIGQLKDATLRNELKNSISGVTDNDITGNEKYGWQVKVANKAFAISKTGEVNEAYWEEVRDANGNVTEIKRVDGLVTGLKIGDTIGYNPLDGATITQIPSNQSVNGYEDQTIKLSDYNGTNSYFKLKGRTGCQNAESELNRICSIYGKGKYAESARSINVEDINKITGYDPEHTGVNTNIATAEEIATGAVYGKNQLHQYENKVTYSWKGDPYPKYTSNVAGWESGNLSSPHNWSTLKGFFWWNGTSFQKSDYTTTPGKICELTSDYYFYYSETLTEKNTDSVVGLTSGTVARDMLFATETRDHYWLASSCINTYSNYAYFVARLVGSGYVTGVNLALSDGHENGIGIGLRPVVSLKSDIQLKEDGNGVWKFVEN